MLKTDYQVTEAHDGQTAVLKRGFGTFHVGSDAVSIGPGYAEYRMFEMRNGQPMSDTFRVLVTLETPVEHTLKIRYGAWSPAEECLIQAQGEEA
jgi:hypothetical protein